MFLLHNIIHRGHGRDGQLGIGDSLREDINGKEKVQTGDVFVGPG